MSAFADLREILDRALESERGLVLVMDSPGKATNLVQKMNYFRRQERLMSHELYPPEHRMFGRTAWDGLRIMKPAKDSCEVHVNPLTADIKEIREL